MLVAANVFATIVRFIVLRAAIAPDRASPPQPTSEPFDGTLVSGVDSGSLYDLTGAV